MKKLLSALLVLISLALFFVFDFHILGTLTQYRILDQLGFVFCGGLFAVSTHFLFLSKWSWQKSALFMGCFALALLFILSLFRWQMPSRNSLAYYQYPLGNCSEWLGPMIRTERGQKAAAATLHEVKPSLAYLIFISEEMCRVNSVKSALSQTELPKLCTELGSKDRLNCYLALNEKLQAINPYSITGVILNEAIGVTNSMILKKEETLRLERKLNDCEEIKYEANLLEIVVQGMRQLDIRSTPQTLLSSVDSSTKNIQQDLVAKLMRLAKSGGSPGSYLKIFLQEMPNRQTELAALTALDTEMANDADVRMQSIAESILLKSGKEIQNCSGLREPSSARDPALQQQLDRVKTLKLFFEKSKLAHIEQR